jgi:peptidoglycan/LPS O-acetylase OafA/YrhL
MERARAAQRECGAGARDHRPALDGVRFVAVYLVVAFHGGLGAARGGFIGVDLFFVLSGFLITGLLLNDIERFGRVRFGRFYSRRARRLLPAAVLTTIGTSVVFLLIAGVVQRLPFVSDAQSALLYVANWHFLHEQNNYFATGVANSPFLHFWSLAIEEQFYVVFPLLLVVVSRVGRRRWVTAAVLALLLVGSVAAQLHWASADPNHAYYGTDARAYQLLAGALLAIGVRGRRLFPTRRLAEIVAGVGLVGVVVLGSGLVSISVSHRGLAATVASVLLLAGLSLGEGGRVGRLLAHRVPAYLGRISYSTYLWHWPVIVALRQLVSLNAVELTAAAAVIGSALAALSTAFLEMPIRRATVLDRFQWPAVATGVTACVLVAFSFVPPVLHSARRPVVTTAANAARPAAATARVHQLLSREHRHVVVIPRHARVPSGLNWAAIANHNGPGRTCTAQNPQACVAVTGSGPTVLLVGDSHARMMAPLMIALAREYHFTLAINAVSGCPWQSQLVNLHDPPAAQAACTAARDQWYREVMPRLHPDVVVLAEYARDDPAIYGQTLVHYGGSSNQSLHRLLTSTTDLTLGQITASGAHALVMKSIFASTFDPLDCLSRAKYVDDCQVPVPAQPPFSDAMYARAARQIPNVSTFNINPIVCPTAPVCEPMVGRIPVWRNFNHYTPAILLHYKEQIWSLISRGSAFSTATAK